MSNIVNAQFDIDDNTIVRAVVDGAIVSFPASADNRHYAEIVEKGIAIAPYVVPVLTYKELRAVEYNLLTTGEQFGLQYDDAKNGTTTWVDWQTEIKLRIPER